MSRRNRSSQTPPPIAPPPIHPLRRLLRRFLFLLAIFVTVAGPIVVARMFNHDAKLRVLNQSLKPVTEVELVWNGGQETWDEIAPASSEDVVIPEQAVQSIRLRFLGPNGGRNRLLHTGKPPGALARLFLSRRIDFLIREDPLHPGSLTSTIRRHSDVNLRELLGLDD